MFKNSIKCIAHCHKGYRIAEFQCLLRQKAIKNAIEAIPKIGQGLWMPDNAIMDHIEHINPGSKSFCQHHGIGCCAGGDWCKVGGKENPLEWKSLWSDGLNLWPN